MGLRDGSGLGNSAGPRRAMVVVAAVFTVLFAISALRVAWFGDDWLITLRTALNAANGNGLTYNVDEHVAGYTHPLWLLLILGIGKVTGSWVYSVMLLSVALSTVAVALLLFRVRSMSALFLVGSAVLFSNTTLEWSSSGLENPLAALLVVCLIVLMPDAGSPPARYAAWGFTASLVILTRMDLALLIAPILVGVSLSGTQKLRQAAAVGLGLLPPLLIWSLFSWQYYGSVLPNTYLAKTNIDIPASDLVGQGLFYLMYSFRFDPLIITPLLAGVAAFVIVRSLRVGLVLVGIGLYLGYVVSVGGDFMAGRFLAVPSYAALAAVVVASRSDIRNRPSWRTVMLLLAGVNLVAAFAFSLVFRADTTELMPVERGVVDERAFWLVSAHTNAFDGYPAYPQQAPFGGMDAQAIEARAGSWAHVEPSQPMPVEVQYAVVGYWGMRAGPGVHLIDLCALTDRFLAMQTFRPSGEPPREEEAFLYSGPGWRVGHYGRELPDGYVEAVQSGDPGLVREPALADQLRELWGTIRNRE